MHKNCWPSQTGCEETEDAFKKIGHLISDIGILIAHHCDLFVRARLANGSKFSSIERTLRNSRAAKGRLLHYYPPDGDSVSSGGQDVDEMWCGYHNDHGTLTGLISGAFFRSGKAEVIEKSPDSSAGLYVVRSEGARAEKASIPSDCLAFQIGESAQIATGGLLRATPHAVRMPSSAIDVSRVTLAVFLQPNPWDILRLPGKDECKVKSVLQTHSLVPPLSARYEDNQSFHDFTAETFKAYYD